MTPFLGIQSSGQLERVGAPATVPPHLGRDQRAADSLLGRRPPAAAARARRSVRLVRIEQRPDGKLRGRGRDHGLLRKRGCGVVSVAASVRALGAATRGGDRGEGEASQLCQILLATDEAGGVA
eukprot:CAMPEP_0204580138 /NCGR_PEP_ID=MMETSP0661-20131031/43892_1 /ASSEMBLY_ACC=CAM_ASM_000606 /TAXON_ID=109239 /ORGANISM="Alexandrium margalefi, Strain AMGDE01CS-322" /LENGTH=123 /DNA_ID=CAMNT_0051589207 /DNA_START=64 /DNA_END=433 /DNA_ORIENTATION=-